MRQFSFISFLLSLKSGAPCIAEHPRMKLAAFPVPEAMVLLNGDPDFGAAQKSPVAALENQSLTSQPSSGHMHNLQGCLQCSASTVNKVH